MKVFRKMPLNLVVPSLNQRRKSDGCLHKTAEKHVPESKKSNEQQNIDQNLLDVLYKNFDFVSALADIEKDSLSRPTSRQFYFRTDAMDSFDKDSLNSNSSSTDDGCRFPWIRHQVKSFFRDILDAFSSSSKEIHSDHQHDGTKLSALALRRDLKRCFAALHPLLEVGAALQDLILWKNPLSTLLLSLVFFYSIVKGWTASLVLLLLLFQLSLNYLSACKQIDVGLCFLPRRKVPLPHFDATGAQIIFDIAKTVQGLLRFAADVFEKLNNLLTWKDVQVTFVFYCLVVYWLLLSLIFNTGTCLGMCAFTLGIRIFITTYLFDRFPKLRFRLDTYGYFYRNLPIGKEDSLKEDKSDHDLEHRSLSPLPRPTKRCSSPSNPLHEINSAKSLDTSLNSLYNSQSIEIESSGDEQPSTEEIDLLMDTVVTWRHCILHERNRSFPKSIITGILYLTDTALAFRPKNNDPNNWLPPMTLFHDIVSVKKVTTLRTVGLIAGSRKAIEIRLVNRRRSVQFLGVANRDEFVEKMREMCIKQQASTHFVIDDNDEAE